MKHLCLLGAIVLTIASVLSTPASAMELDAFLADINVSARADLGGFRADLSAAFHVSSGDVDKLFDVFDEPADVYMCLRIRDVARVSIERVTTEYRRHGGHGWGVIAKSLGIKPGSAEFHALKQRMRAAGVGPGKHGKPAPGNVGKQAKNGK